MSLLYRCHYNSKRDVGLVDDYEQRSLGELLLWAQVRLIRHLKKRRLIGSSDSSHKSNGLLGVLNCYGPKFRRRHRIWHLKEAATTHQKQRQLTWQAHALGPSDDRIRHQKEETT